MPSVPSVWYSGPLSPQQLNNDLYSPNGSGYSANGILFFTHRPLLHEALTASRLMTVTTSGTWNVIPGTNTTAFAVADTSALFGTGGDNPGPYALYQFIPNALASSGIGYQPGNLSPVAAQASSGTAPAFPAGAGGNYLVFHTITGQTAGSSPAAIGAGLSQTPGFGEVFVWQGGDSAAHHRHPGRGVLPGPDQRRRRRLRGSRQPGDRPAAVPDAGAVR